ncbi:ABC transporter substrate-binding protein [Paenalcaligenes hominis]|uniref:ABC transporter substrate-binding protein n=1 Tax=Paenalcaligenes hominis TaxID=643674 RepID=A0A1U9K288_9BURK|nr:transporter substrate-binding domain-containing protein [Paenalcaligenes hominis]AQS52155.1 ABC transporter substrate-binding protein [Paenalcaligenes hominis]
MKKNLLRLALAALFTVSAATQAADLKEIRIATEAGYPPFEFIAPNGEIQGFNIDIGNEICKRLEAKCVWIDQSFDSLIPGLQARKFDLANSTMTATDARRKVIDFTTPLYIVASRLVASKDKNLEPTAESLKGLRIGVQQGTTMETYARKEWAPKGVQIIAYPSYTNAFTDLAAGRIDASFQEAPNAVDGFLDKPEGANFHLTGAVINNSPILNEPIAIGLRKGNKELKAAVDETIKAMLEDGTIQQFSEKYFQPQTIELPSGH